MMRPYEELANAIIIRAVQDWKIAVRKLKRNPDHAEALLSREACERFFLSDWCYALGGVDGKIILRKLEKDMKVERYGQDHLSRTGELPGSENQQSSA